MRGVASSASMKLDGGSTGVEERVGADPLLLVHVPHSSSVIPPKEREELLLDDDDLRTELALMTDWHTDRLAREAVLRSRLLPALNPVVGR